MILNGENDDTSIVMKALKMKTNIVRNSSVEFLRCLLMFLIVFEHCMAHGVFIQKSPYGIEGGLWTIPFALVWWHVDAFVAISGWYGIKFRWSKFLRLYGVILFYSLLSLAYQLLVAHEPLNFKAQLIYGGWFGATYTMLMLMAPLLNAGVEALVAEGRRIAFFSWLVFAIGVVLNWSPYTRWATAVCPLGAGPFTIFNMVFVYVTARMARRLEFDFGRRRLAWSAVAILVGGILLCGGVNAASYVLRHKPVTGMAFGGYSSYDAPHIWLFAVAIVMYFARYVRVPEWLGRLGAFVGPSTFAIFLFHHATCFGNDIYRVQQFALVDRWGVHPLPIIAVTAVSTFVLCLMVDLLRRVVFGLVRPRSERVLAWLDRKWDDWVSGAFSA